MLWHSITGVKFKGQGLLVPLMQIKTCDNDQVFRKSFLCFICRRFGATKYTWRNHGMHIWISQRYSKHKCGGNILGVPLHSISKMTPCHETDIDDEVNWTNVNSFKFIKSHFIVIFLMSLICCIDKILVSNGDKYTFWTRLGKRKVLDSTEIAYCLRKI